jgi:hypothetical protein
VSEHACVAPHRHEPDRLRPAATGTLLCQGHLTGLERHLAEVTAIYDWLGACMVRDGTGATDAPITGSREAPTPLRVSLHDLRADICAKLSSWTHLVTEDRAMRGPDHFDDPHAASGWLMSQVVWIAGQEWVDEFWTEVDDWHRLARSAAPWDRDRRNLPAPCPDCSLLALSLYGGDDHVTCRNCGHVIPQDRYGFYVRLLVDEEEERKRRAAEKAEPAA